MLKAVEGKTNSLLRVFACPYPYVFVKRECPRDAKFFYGITENKKSANEHLTQTMFFSVFAKQAGYVTIKTTSKMKEIRRINHVLWKLWETIK